MNRIIRRRALPAEIPAFGDMDPLLARIFAARGVSAADELQLDLARLVPVGRFAGLDEALALLVEHRERGSRILIVGDFDAPIGVGWNNRHGFAANIETASTCG